jgi:hypothetical protein
MKTTYVTKALNVQKFIVLPAVLGRFMDPVLTVELERKKFFIPLSL